MENQRRKLRAASGRVGRILKDNGALRKYVVYEFMKKDLTVQFKRTPNTYFQCMYIISIYIY